MTTIKDDLIDIKEKISNPVAPVVDFTAVLTAIAALETKVDALVAQTAVTPT